LVGTHASKGKDHEGPFVEMRKTHVVRELGIGGERFLAGAAFAHQPLRVPLRQTSAMLVCDMVEQAVLGECSKPGSFSGTVEATEQLEPGCLGSRNSDIGVQALGVRRMDVVLLDDMLHHTPVLLKSWCVSWAQVTVEELERVYGKEPVLYRVLVREEDSRLRAQAAPHLPILCSALNRLFIVI